MQQKTCNYIELFGSSTRDRHARSADVQIITLNASCMTISDGRNEQLYIIAGFLPHHGFTSDFLSFIVVEHIRFFHRAIQVSFFSAVGWASWRASVCPSVSPTAIFSGGPGLATTRMSPFWILLELSVTEVLVKYVKLFVCPIFLQWLSNWPIADFEYWYWIFSRDVLSFEIRIRIRRPDSIRKWRADSKISNINYSVIILNIIMCHHTTNYAH